MLLYVWEEKDVYYGCMKSVKKNFHTNANKRVEDKESQGRKMKMLIVVWTELKAVTAMTTVDTDGKRLPTNKEKVRWISLLG